MWNPFVHLKTSFHHNFGEVVPGKLYRSGEPDIEDLREWRDEYGIQTVVDLRILSPTALEKERKLVVLVAGLKYVNIPMDDHAHAPVGAVDQFLDIMNTKAALPVLVHCEGGRHRTGYMVAAYRVFVQGWTPAQAYKEAKKYGFYGSFGHEGLKEDILGL